MKLVTSLTSPYARKVRMALAEKSIAFELIPENPWSDDTTVPTLNPLGKIPVLLYGNNEALYDSRVILDYLEIVKPQPALLPSDAMQRIAVKKWEALADGVSDAAVAMLLEGRRPSAQQNADWITRQRDKVERGLAAMDSALSGSFCVGQQLTLADIAVGCTLGYLDFRFPDIRWQERYLNLAKHYQQLSLRPSFVSTIPVA